jgi:hypothetical protein
MLQYLRLTEYQVVCTRKGSTHGIRNTLHIFSRAKRLSLFLFEPLPQRARLSSRRAQVCIRPDAHACHGV